MKISEIAALIDLSISTIRYYEKSGLCPPITRGADGNRQFSTGDLDWLLLLSSLRETGMPIREMQDFAALYHLGDVTIPERKATLLMHGQRLKRRQAELDRCRDILSRKLTRYDEVMGDET